MLYGLNGATTDQCSLEEDVEVAGKAEYDVLELRTYKLETYLKKNTLTDLNRLFAESKVKADAVNAIEAFNLKNGREREKVLEQTAKWCEIAQAAGSSYVIVVPSPRPEGVNDQKIIQDSVIMLKEMAEIAEEYNINLALEFVGIETFSIGDLETANLVIEQVNRKNVGLVIDVFHFYTCGSPMSGIQKLNVDKIFVVQLNDAEHDNVSELADNNRVFPGQGVIPLKEIGEKLQHIGYSRILSLELFREEYWEMDKQELGTLSYKHLKKAAEYMFPIQK